MVCNIHHKVPSWFRRRQLEPICWATVTHEDTLPCLWDAVKDLLQVFATRDNIVVEVLTDSSHTVITENDWTRKIFQWLIQKYLKQCTILYLYNLYSYCQAATYKSWRKPETITETIACYKISENDVKKMSGNVEIFLMKKREDKIMLELENFKITAYLFSFQIIWESVCIFLRFLLQVMSHPSYLIYIIIHQRTVKNSLNQIHHGDDLSTLNFII